MIFLDALTLNNLKKIKCDLGIKSSYKNKDNLINSIGKIFYNLSNTDQLDIIKRLDINYKKPNIIDKNTLNKYKIVDLKYYLFLKNIQYNGNKINLIKSVENIMSYYTIYNINQKNNEIVRLQKILKKILYKRKTKLQGITLYNRSMCNNSNEFITYDDIKDIDEKFYISYRDIDGFYYGFDIRSINHMIEKNIELINPYNRNKFTLFFINNIHKLINKIKDRNIDLKLFNDQNEEKTPDEIYKDEVMEICQKIDELGYYSILEWFSNLSIYQLRKFNEYLVDIWSYRLQLSFSQKIKIVPPNGMPFRRSISQINTNDDIHKVRKHILYSIKKMIYSAISEEDQKLGCMYVLMALTMVNTIAAQDLPWLYQSAMII